MPGFRIGVECITLKPAWNLIVNYGHAGGAPEDRDALLDPALFFIITVVEY